MSDYASIPGRATLRVALLTFVFMVTNAFSQTIQLQGGTSTQMSATGASIGISGQNRQGWVGAGEIQGHFRFGAYSQMKLTENVALAAGDDTSTLMLPTDIFTGGQYILTRGVGLLLGSDKTRDRVYLFGGASSLGYGTGFFRAAEADAGIGLAYFDRRLNSRLRLFSRNAFGASQTSINGLEWKPTNRMSAAVAAGAGGGSPYLAGSFSGAWEKLELKTAFSTSGEQFRRIALTAPAVSEIDGANAAITYRPWSALSFSASHNRYETYDLEHGTVSRANTDQGTVNFSAARFNVGGSVYETSVMGRSATAFSLFGSRPVGRWLTTTVTALRSGRWGGGTDTTVIVSTREKVHPRVALSQFLTRANGSTNFNFGGELYTNPFRLNVDYQTVYVPYYIDQPFRQALSLSATARVFGGTELTLGTFVDPMGRLRYTLSMNRYLYRNAASRPGGELSQWSMGNYLVRGRVLDEGGSPVGGAAVTVGGQFAYTDVNGRFFVRVRDAKQQAFKVVPDEFTAPGYWKLLSAPVTVMPMPEGRETEFEIRVKQLTGEEARKKLQQEQTRQSAQMGSSAAGS